MNTDPKKNTSSHQEYEYTYDAFNQISPCLKYPMAASILFEDNSLTKEKWANDVSSILLRIRSNQAMYDVAINHSRCSTLKFIFDLKFWAFLNNPNNSKLIRSVYNLLLWIFRYVVPLFSRTKQKGRTRSSKDEIANAFLENNIKEKVKIIKQEEKRSRKINSKLSLRSYQDLFQIIYLPCVAKYVQEDRTFAAQRVAGVNPLVIEGVQVLPQNFPVMDSAYQSVMGIDDSLQKALVEKRLYITDYKILQDIIPGTVDDGDGTVQKYIYHPIALFAIESGDCPNRRLVPVAIQCYQEPSSENPIFIAPSIHATASEKWAWQMAKLTVQIADANYHEFISHLGGTHLRIEPIAISTYRKLPLSHPLGALLTPHLEGTLFINDAAVKGLINPDGTVDKVASGTLESSILLSVKGAKEYPFSFNESFLPLTLKRRGVEDPHTLPNYPYRDDAILIWNATHEWVSSYLKLFYQDDDAIQKDPEIQAWIQDLTAPNGGQMTGIGEIDSSSPTPQIRTLAYLIDAVTLIIFTASVTHAAVNFPQSAFMTYMPNMPLAGYGKAPRKDTEMTEAHYFSLIPSLTQSETQMNMTYLLGSVYYTKLGCYGESYFTDSRVISVLQKFQASLREIELEIKARNEVRSIHYDVLLPSKIPQSINI